MVQVRASSVVSPAGPLLERQFARPATERSDLGEDMRLVAVAAKEKHWRASQANQSTGWVRAIYCLPLFVACLRCRIVIVGSYYMKI